MDYSDGIKISFKTSLQLKRTSHPNDFFSEEAQAYFSITSITTQGMIQIHYVYFK